MKRKNNVSKEHSETKHAFSLEDIYPEGSLNAVKHFDSDRTITRPVLHLKRVIIKVVAVLTATALLGIIAKFILNHLNIEKSNTYALIISSVILFIVVVARLKKILIWFVLIYQKFAPERIRKKCVFTPSCSEYMILSLEKYGVVKGLIKGIKRLKRCHLPNYGEDYP